jgi:serine phosphatase RsbU (regulator of sigma subunit)/anti-sigma regulatory factor (Ser/Thr protein kinase)/tetratricopeptide (TPR) repeat protein/transposase
MFRRVIKEECKVPADLKYLGEMRNFITHAGRKYGIPERVLNSFKLAIDEAGTNIIRHAYRDWDGFITIRMVIRNKDVTVSLIDQGHTFDLRQVRDPDLKRYVDIGKKGGLGIFIIRRVVDAIDYRKTVEGNELKLIKSIPHFSKRYPKLPGMGLPLKAKYSVYAGILWTLLIVISWMVSNSQQRDKIIKTDFTSGRSLAKTFAHQCIDPLAREETVETARIAAEFQRDHAPVVLDALVVDSSGAIQGSVKPEQILEPYRSPENTSRVAESIRRYRTESGAVVYDVAEPIVPQVTGVQIGQVHLLLDKKVTDQKVAAGRRQNLRMFLIILAMGYGGIFGLVFLIMSPLKRLLRWINAAGQGEVQDDVEFDASDEIGEIAHAFNEITEKFRKSQENLAEQERLQKEMQVAQEIQHTLLPSSFPQIEGYELSSYYEAAREVGGDYFDFVEVDKETLGIVVADVSGKGVPGSLIMTMIRTALRTEARGNKNAADVLARVNEFVINDMKRGMFVTVFYIILDSHNRTINYASAGHNPMILYRGQSNKSYYLNPRGFPIGLNLPDRTLFRKSIESDTIHLKEGDVLIVYTDGVTEAMNAPREKFGEERFLSIIRKCGRMKVDPLVDHIRDEIKAFTGGEAQSDDITLVAIKEKMKAEDVLFNLRSRLLRSVGEEGLSVKEACQKMGVSTSTYYKYKKRFDKMGTDGLKEQTIRSEVEEKHIAIEDKVKLLDVIKNNPDFGPKKIVEELKTEKYGFTVIDEKRIYDELVKSRLNTKDLRKAFAQRGEKGKRTKPPGTPFLTLDGQIILDSGRRREVRPIPWPFKASDQKDKTPTIEIRVSQLKKEEKEPVVRSDDNQGREVSAVGDDSDVMSISDKKTVQPHLKSEIHTKEGEPQFLEENAFFEFDQQKAESAEDLLNWAGLQAEKSESTEKSQFDQILEPRADEFHEEESEQAEEHIANSVGGELFEDEFVGLDESSETPETTEDMGIFERINGSVFESDTVVASRGSKDESRIASMLREMNRRRHMDSGQWFYRQGLYAKAIEEFRKIVEEKPDSWEAYQHLGDSWFRLGQLDKAVEAYEKVKLLNPNNLAVLENLGVIFANRGDYKKAVWQWGEVLKKNPQRTDIIDRIKRMQKLIRQHVG